MEFSFASKDTDFFLLVTAEISQVVPGLAKFGCSTKMAIFGMCNGSKIGNKMVWHICCVMPVTQAVSFEVDILKHRNVRYHWFQLCAWDH